LRRQFATYLLIGGTVAVVDFTVFQLGVTHHVQILVASTISYFTATTTHFLLNRYANFRRFDRAIHDQFRTFVVIIFGQWIVTLAIINVMVSHGAWPLAARATAIAVNIPFGFLANRYLTFGVGIIPRVLRRYAEKRP
jgi:putative flippase GtrA